mmetsp:Transcript_1734/g.3560  ORF Transcript_1734/g.3560 Transcript_1734/m.3560 type:complete len:175 (-) Transcript_1734:7-531(-)
MGATLLVCCEDSGTAGCDLSVTARAQEQLMDEGEHLRMPVESSTRRQNERINSWARIGATEHGFCSSTSCASALDAADCGQFCGDQRSPREAYVNPYGGTELYYQPDTPYHGDDSLMRPPLAADLGSATVTTRRAARKEKELQAARRQLAADGLTGLVGVDAVQALRTNLQRDF